ncbi:MAG: hypothetical protein ACP5UM_14735 [Anaerolineae bacterium]
MSSEEELRRLIAEGRYWEALGFKPGTPTPEIILRVVDLTDEHPGLGAELNRVQVALTQVPGTYATACQARDLVCARLATAFGKGVTEVLGPAVVWQQVWNRASAQPDLRPASLAEETWQALNCEVEQLPEVDFTASEVRAGHADRIGTVHGRRCPLCGGAGEVQMTMQQVVTRARSDAAFRRKLTAARVPLELFAWIVQRQPERAGEKIAVPCTCAEVIAFQLPVDLKAGWVVTGRRASDGEPAYVRVGAVTAPPHALSWDQIRGQLLARYGPTVFALLPESVLQEQARLLGEGREAAAQVVQTVQDLVAQLPALEFTSQEVMAGQATRFVQQQGCRRCGGTGRLVLEGIEVLQMAEKNGALQDHLRREGFPIDDWLDFTQGQATLWSGRRQIGQNSQLWSMLENLRVEMPCPDCARQIRFTLPQGVSQGHVVQGKRQDTGAEVFVTVQAVVKEARAPAKPRPSEPTWTFQDKLVEGIKLIAMAFGVQPAPYYWANGLWKPGLRGLAYMAAFGLLLLGAANTPWIIESARANPTFGVVFLIFGIGLLLSLLEYASGPRE